MLTLCTIASVVRSIVVCSSVVRSSVVRSSVVRSGVVRSSVVRSGVVRSSVVHNLAWNLTYKHAMSTLLCSTRKPYQPSKRSSDLLCSVLRVFCAFRRLVGILSGFHPNLSDYIVIRQIGRSHLGPTRVRGSLARSYYTIVLPAPAALSDKGPTGRGEKMLGGVRKC